MSEGKKRGGKKRRKRFGNPKIEGETPEQRQRRLERENDLRYQQIVDQNQGRIEWGRRLPVRYEE